MAEGHTSQEMSWSHRACIGSQGSVTNTNQVASTIEMHSLSSEAGVGPLGFTGGSFCGSK